MSQNHLNWKVFRDVKNSIFTGKSCLQKVGEFQEGKHRAWYRLNTCSESLGLSPALFLKLLKGFLQVPRCISTSQAHFSDILPLWSYFLYQAWVKHMYAITDRLLIFSFANLQRKYLLTLYWGESQHTEILTAIHVSNCLPAWARGSLQGLPSVTIISLFKSNLVANNVFADLISYWNSVCCHLFARFLQLCKHTLYLKSIHLLFHCPCTLVY